jgi:hypothetical protein
VLTDAPVVAGDEAVGGYIVFDCDNLEPAIDLALRVPAARMGGAVELRPIVEQRQKLTAPTSARLR